MPDWSGSACFICCRWCIAESSAGPIREETIVFCTRKSSGRRCRINVRWVHALLESMFMGWIKARVCRWVVDIVFPLVPRRRRIVWGRVHVHRLRKVTGAWAFVVSGSMYGTLRRHQVCVITARPIEPAWRGELREHGIWRRSE